MRPTLTTLGRAPANSREAFISPNLATSNSVSRSGYVIQVEGSAVAGAPGSCNGLGVGEAAQGWRAHADPSDTDNTRFFATNVNGSIWEHTGDAWQCHARSGRSGESADCSSSAESAPVTRFARSAWA